MSTSVEIRFDPPVCPQCGGKPASTLDNIQGQAELDAHDDGTYEYSGYTEILWDTATSERDAQGRISVACEKGHEWFATMTEGD